MGHISCGKDVLDETCLGHRHAESNVQPLKKAHLIFADVLRHLFIILDALMLEFLR